MVENSADERAQEMSLGRVILEVSTSFINLDTSQIDEGIEAALARIGTFCDVDRAYVFALGDETMSNTYEWSSPGVSREIDNLQDLPLSIFPWWISQIKKNVTIHIPATTQLPDEAQAEREILLAQGICSVAVVPMVFNRKAIGFIGFDSIRRNKHWKSNDFTLLRIAGEIVTNALERKRSEVARVALEEQLIQARSLENVARLAGGVAHDFNNLLTIILNHTQLIRRDCQDIKLLGHTDVLLEAAEQAADLTRQLMIVGRREFRQQDVLELNSVLTALQALLGSSLGESIEFKVQLATSPCWVLLGQPHIKQIIVNLVVNARDALPQGGHVSIETQIVNSTTSGPFAPRNDKTGWVCLRVTDDGAGMSSEVKKRAFEPFFSTKGTNGTGLGLSTLYSIVKQAGGKVHIDSQLGSGTSVSVYLPQAGRPEKKVESTARPSFSPRGKGELILLVEDSDPLRKLVEEMLLESGYRVIAAAHPEVVLSSFRGQMLDIELLLTDVILPGMSGRVLASRLRESLPEIRVAYISGQDDQILAQQGVVDAGVWLLPKPFREAALLHFVRQVLDAAHPPASGKWHPNAAN